MNPNSPKKLVLNCYIKLDLQYSPRLMVLIKVLVGVNVLTLKMSYANRTDLALFMEVNWGSEHYCSFFKQ